MRLPLIGVCDNDISLFETAESAAAYMEPWDVEDHLWRVWDADGMALRLVSDGRSYVEVAAGQGRGDVGGLLEAAQRCAVEAETLEQLLDELRRRGFTR